MTLEGTPDAGEILRIALLGGPGLIELLRQPEARSIAMRIGASVTVPAAEAALPASIIPAPAAEEPARRGLLGAFAGVAAVIAAVLAWSVWPRAEAVDPPDTSTPAAVVAQETAPLQPAPPVPPPSQQEAPVAGTPEPPIAVAPEPPAPKVSDTAATAKAADVPAPKADTAPGPKAEEAPAVAAAEPAPAPPAPAAAETARVDAPEPRPAAREASAPKAVPAPQGAALQVGAFVRADGAESLRQKLASQFPSVYVSPAKRGDGTTFHRVRIGGFRSTHDLDLAAAVLRTEGYVPMRVRE
jgi:hypothetical protein